MKLALDRPELISLAAGFVDPHTLPCDGLAPIAQDILTDAEAGPSALQYDTTAGLPALRQQLADHFQALDSTDSATGPRVDPDHILVTNGSQQLLHLITEVLTEPGDLILTGWPSYFVYTSALPAFGVDVRGVAMDEHGIRVDALKQSLEALHRAGQLRKLKLLYLVSYHQNPTGITLDESRKPEILELLHWAERQSGQPILLVEDAAYRELTYDSEAPRSFRSYDATGARTALLQTFSKPFAPGLKTGYGVLPAGLIEPVLREKGARDFGTANFGQNLLLRAMETGLYAKHVEVLKQAYRVKRDATLDALQAELGDLPGVTWTRPSGGLYVWVSLPPEIQTGLESPLFERCLAEGMFYVPGEFGYPPDRSRAIPSHQLRLSFGVPEVPTLREGVARFARALRAIVSS